MVALYSPPFVKTVKHHMYYTPVHYTYLCCINFSFIDRRLSNPAGDSDRPRIDPFSVKRDAFDNFFFDGGVPALTPPNTPSAEPFTADMRFNVAAESLFFICAASTSAAFDAVNSASWVRS